MTISDKENEDARDEDLDVHKENADGHDEDSDTFNRSEANSNTSSYCKV